MKLERVDGALLAGACAGLARMLGWNVWAIRALFVVFLLAKTVWALAAYAVLAVAVQLLGGAAVQDDGSRGLESPELEGRSRRITELEKRFEELERRK